MGSSCRVGVCLGRLESYIIEKIQVSFSLLFHVAVSQNINERHHREERQVKRMGFTTVLSMRVGDFDDVWVIMKRCFFCLCVRRWRRTSENVFICGDVRPLRAWRAFVFFFKPGRMLNLVFLPAPAVSSTCAMKRHTQAHAALQLSHLSSNMGKHHAPSGTCAYLVVFLFFFCAPQLVQKKDHPFHFLCKLHRERLELEREWDQSALFVGRRRGF